MVKTINKPAENDVGVLIQALIQDNIDRLQICYIAKVLEVKGNKVNVIPMIGNSKIEIPSLMVAIPYSSNFNQSMKINKGDIGLCVVCNNDISTYSNSGSGGIPISNRTHDLIDSVFIPLSLYESDISSNSITSNIDYSIESKENLTLKGNKISLKNDNESVKSLLSDLVSILKGLQTIPAVNGSMLTLNANSIADLEAWNNKLDTLFED